VVREGDFENCWEWNPVWFESLDCVSMMWAVDDEIGDAVGGGWIEI